MPEMDGIAAAAALRKLETAVRLVASGEAMLSPSVTRTLLYKLGVDNRVHVAIVVHDAGLGG